MLEMISELSIDYLMSTPLSDDVEKAMDMFASVQERLYTLAVSRDSESLVKMKAGTIVTLAVLKKLAEGKDPRKLTKEDWQDIARSAGEYIQYTDGADYSMFVFNLYADYIHWSAKALKGTATKERIAAIDGLADELRHKAAMLQAREITETAYIEDCLWISLEAMVKLLASVVRIKGIENSSDLTYAAATYAFEYGRMKLYQQEQALVTEYLNGQKRLDGELEEKLEDFKAKMEIDAERFNDLLNEAFEPGFRDRLQASVFLARTAGVKEEEILKTAGEIDEFFLD